MLNTNTFNPVINEKTMFKSIWCINLCKTVPYEVEAICEPGTLFEQILIS